MRQPTEEIVTAGIETTDGSAGDGRRTAPGERLGRYLVIEEVGRGGMGVVLRAYDPRLQREVAIKRVRTDTLAEAAQARLEREARAMARLSHPNVVAIYDVELGDRDRDVLLVMEYVPGFTLAQWLRDAPRSPAEIVAAFVAAGRGLAAAHSEGLLHRDFKLDNVLVSGSPMRVRVTDFGLARATGPKGSVDSLDPRSGDEHGTTDDGVSIELTAAGTVMGTPPYMAPEQADGGEIDARADQYAFCVAMWRALARRWPFEGRGDALVQAKRAGPPGWPSDAAAPRHVVDAIRRGLAPDPGHRWPSVDLLLAELERDPGRRRRRRWALGAVALAGLGVWGGRHLLRVRALATCGDKAERLAEVWSDDRADAIASAFTATGVTYAADTWERSRARLDGYAREWIQRRTDLCEAEVDATLPASTIAAARACLDEHADELAALLDELAAPDPRAIQEAATATASLPDVAACSDEPRLRQRAELPLDAERVRALRSFLAQARAASVTGRYDAALVNAQGVMKSAIDLPSAVLAVEARLEVGSAYQALARYEDASVSLEQAFYDATALGRDDEALEAASGLVFSVGYGLNRYEDATLWGRIAESIVDRLGRSETLAVATLLSRMASVSRVRGDYPEARELNERALAILEATVGTEHPLVASSLNNLGNVLGLSGEYDAALPLYERALAIRIEALGPEHPHVATAIEGIGNVYMWKSAYARSMPLHEQALAIREKTLGPDHPLVGKSLTNIGSALQSMREYDAAVPYHERALAIAQKAHGPEHADVAATYGNLGTLYMSKGDIAKAKTSYARAVEIFERTVGSEHLSTVTSLEGMANVHHAEGDLVHARELMEKVVAVREKGLGPKHPHLAESLVILGSIHASAGAHADAIAIFRRALAIQEAVLPAEHGSIADTRLALERSLQAE